MMNYAAPDRHAARCDDDGRRAKRVQTLGLLDVVDEFGCMACRLACLAVEAMRSLPNRKYRFVTSVAIGLSRNTGNCDGIRARQL